MSAAVFIPVALAVAAFVAWLCVRAGERSKARRRGHFDPEGLQ